MDGRIPSPAGPVLGRDDEGGGGESGGGKSRRFSCWPEGKAHGKVQGDISISSAVGHGRSS